MPRLRNILSSSPQPQVQAQHITPARGNGSSANNSPEEVGGGKDCLVSELEKLYWLGAKAELDNVIKTLRIWRESEAFQDVRNDGKMNVPDASEGYDHFLDSVSQWTREYASKYDEMMNEARTLEKQSEHSLDWDSYQQTTAHVLLHRKMKNTSSKIRKEVKSHMKPVDGDQQEQLAWLLLQAAGFLDIDKIIEHRQQPDYKSSRQPAIPQLARDGTDRDGMPMFKPQRCQRLACESIITSSMYVGISGDVICEPCYRKHHNRMPGFNKDYKHCALNDAMDAMAAEVACKCPNVMKHDKNGERIVLFPCDPEAGHLPNCDLYKLGSLEANAKYEALKDGLSGEDAPKRGGLSSAMARLTSKDDKLKPGSSEKRKSSPGGKRSSVFGGLRGGSVVQGDQGVITDPAEDTNVPQFFRQFADGDALSHVHMSLRVGPLVIENGVGGPKNGALITIREMPHMVTDSKRPNASLLVDGERRKVWRQEYDSELKRYKAITKQVVGSPFGDFPNGGGERDIVGAVVDAGDSPPLHDPTKTEAEEYDAVLESILGKLKAVLGGRLSTYLGSIAKKLLDPGTALIWDPSTNTCQQFCNSILDTTLFKPLFSGPSGAERADGPLYTMSFVCPDEGYHQRIVHSKDDVAPGFTEEYLGSLYFGRHEESDLIDSCQEYWYEWAALDKPECGHGDLFPFDCTRAFGGPRRDETQDCGNCSLSRHLWAFPFDSWAMISMHLLRDPFSYAQPGSYNPDKPQHVAAWFKNRVAALQAQSILRRGGSAMTGSPALRSATAWMHSDSHRLARQPSLARVRMGGIHRAQPMSHYFDKGPNQLYFLAGWAPMADRALQYRAARAGRATAVETHGETARNRFAKGGKVGGWDLKGKDRAGEPFQGFTGVAAPEVGATGSKPMFRPNGKQVAMAVGMTKMSIIAPNGDTVGGSCAAGALCGSGCGSSSCGGPACGSVGGGGGMCGGFDGSGEGGGTGTCGGGGACGGGAGCFGGGGACGGGGCASKVS